jgi:hypothetical protein
MSPMCRWGAISIDAALRPIRAGPTRSSKTSRSQWALDPAAPSDPDLSNYSRPSHADGDDSVRDKCDGKDECGEGG